MASRVTTTLVDDTDGSEASETISFGLDSVSYDIDLSDLNAKKLREDLAPWIEVARKTGGRRSATRKASSEIDNTAVRAWAEANGIEVSKRGRISQDVVERFRAAGN